MRKIEVVLSPEKQALLVEGNRVAAVTWALTADSIMLLDSNSCVVAFQALGPIGNRLLPALSAIDVLAVDEDGVQELKSLPRNYGPIRTPG